MGPHLRGLQPGPDPCLVPGCSSDPRVGGSARVRRREAARRSALTHVLKTFFDNSAEQAVAALLELKGPKLSEADLERVARLVADAKKEGR